MRRRLLLALLLSVLPATADAQLVEGDRAWAARAEVLDGERAVPDRIEAALGHYRAALAADGDSLQARWRLLRALHYRVDFTGDDADRKAAVLEEAVALAQRSVDLLQSSGGDDADRARVCFWSAIVWGARARRVGLLTLVREGVATRMYELAERSLSLDPSVDRGGALRLLSRLHGDLPRVPFVSGWVERAQVLPLAERAFAADPEHPGNRLILALALLEHAPQRKTRAVELLEGIATGEPEPGMRVEWLSIRRQAREALEALGPS